MDIKIRRTSVDTDQMPQIYWLPRSMSQNRIIAWWRMVRQRHARTCILLLLGIVTITSMRYQHRPRSVPRKVIAWYQLYHGGLRMDAKKVDFNKCEYKNCVIKFMDNRLDIKKQFSSAKAVLFQGGRFPRQPPRRSSKNQAFVFVSIESPLHLQMSNYHANSFWRNHVNWTMTYRVDSDIPYKYGSVATGEATPADKDYRKLYRNKKKMAAWLVSDCKTESNREGFVKKLKHYIAVDVYGKCGSLHNCTKEQGNQCLDQIGQDYKFYLSFENSMCKDYMTEKVYSWFNRDIVSVVRGARTYKNLLPTDTYIHTEDFESVDHLGAFLKELSDNEDAYVEYLENKSKYRAHDARQQVQSAYCEICKRVHNINRYKKTYDSVSKWWGNGACMKNPRDML